MIKCPLCAEEIQDQARICRFCGCDLISGQRAQQSSGQKPDVTPTAVNRSPPENSFQSCMGCLAWVGVIIIGLIAVGSIGDSFSQPVAEDDTPLFENRDSTP